MQRRQSLEWSLYRSLCVLGFCFYTAQMLDSCVKPVGINHWPVNFYPLGRLLMYRLTLNKCRWSYPVWSLIYPKSELWRGCLPYLGSPLLNSIPLWMCKPPPSSTNCLVLRPWANICPRLLTFSHGRHTTEDLEGKKKKKTVTFCCSSCFLKPHWDRSLELTSLNLVLVEIERFPR